MYPISPAFFTGWHVPDHVGLLVSWPSARLLRHGSAIPRQCAKLPRFPNTTTGLWSRWPPLWFLGLPIAADRSQQQPLIRESSGAWDFTPDARSAFHFFLLVPDRLPNQAGTHNDVPIIERLLDLSIDQIRTPFCYPLAGRRFFRSPSRAYPHLRLVAEDLLSTHTDNHQTGGCTRLL